MTILLFFIGIWYASLFFQTFFQHRYAAHGAFQMNKFWERWFFILTYLAQGSSYMSPRAYAIMHRMHHAYTDTEKDPHSPNFSSNVFSMMWRTCNIYEGIYKHTIEVEDRLVILTMGAFHGAIINWFAHKFGYINFRMKNSSHNLFSIDVLMLGESYHNNHHMFPSRINFGRRWHELDPVFACIRFLNWLHIIRIVKEVKV